MILAVANQKGGVGKTFTSQQIALYLEGKGKKVLAVDLDQSGNFTLCMGGSKPKARIKELLDKKCKTVDAIQRIRDNLDLIASNKELATLNYNKANLEGIMADRLAAVKDNYDYVVIDCPPQLNILTISALGCADKVLIPAQADIFSADMVQELGQTILTVKEKINPGLEVLGILITRYKKTNYSTAAIDLLDSIAESLDSKLLENHIRESSALNESAAARQSIFLYDSTNKKNISEDHKAVLKEIGLWCGELKKKRG